MYDNAWHKENTQQTFIEINGGLLWPRHSGVVYRETVIQSDPKLCVIVSTIIILILQIKN